MSKVIIVVSGLVDATIKEYQPDVKFHLFNSINDLQEYIESVPLRADSLFFTRDVIPHVNAALNALAQMLSDPFLTVDNVTYLTEENSKELVSVKYIIESQKLTNWKVIQGNLTREWVDGVINGTLRTEETLGKKKVVYRVPREEYVKEQLRQRSELNTEYESDEERLSEVPEEQEPKEVFPRQFVTCNIFHIVGDDNNERTVFSYLAAQYLSFSGKTLILEKDIEYHRLSEFVLKSNVKCLTIEVDELLNNCERTIEKIKRSPDKLVCVIAVERVKYSYAFLLNLLYHNLSDCLSYIIEEDDFNEVPPQLDFTLAIPATTCALLKALENIEATFASRMNVVGVVMSNIQETRIRNSKQIRTVCDDILGEPIRNATIVTVKSLRIGKGSDYDIGGVLL